MLQLRCHVRLDSAADALRLAASPGPPISRLRLPPLRPPERCSLPAAWAELQQLLWAVERLLTSPAFLRRSAATLAALYGCPRAAAERGAGGADLFARLARLQELSLQAGLSIGSPQAALCGCSLARCPPSLRRLEVALPAGGCVVSHVAGWPEGLERCTLTACGRNAGSFPGGSHTRIAPCGCGACAAAAEAGGGFWPTCREVRVQAAGPLLLHLDACSQLRRCTRLRVASTCAAPAGGAAAPPAAAVPIAVLLQRWLVALAPLFAATQLQRFELHAAVASVAAAADGGGKQLLVGSGPPTWPEPQLTAAAVAAEDDMCECVGGLCADVRQAGGCGAASFELRVSRCDA